MGHTPHYLVLDCVLPVIANEASDIVRVPLHGFGDENRYVLAYMGAG